MNIICTICARGGSKGVPGKNIRNLAGKPLIAWTILQAEQSGLFTTIAVSSDSHEILEAARSAGARILVERPQILASDTSGKLPAISHCLVAAETELGHQADIIVDLDVTSPLRLSNDIIGAVELLKKRNCSNVITGSIARRSPYFNLVECNQLGIVSLSKTLDKPILRRQDAPPCFDMNASIYVWQRNIFFNTPGIFYPDTHLYVMPEERSIDIDTEIDFRFVDMLMTSREK